jgi:S-adenosylmethionine/arginine decarboxylase-like enzyme
MENQTINEEDSYWGYEMILDCSSCKISSITNKENIVNFIRTLVERIDMVAYGEPQIEHFATHCPDKAGFTFVQLIETSSITGHLVDKNGDAYINVFSCKKYDKDVVLRTVKEFFSPKKIRMYYLTRQA